MKFLLRRLFVIIILAFSVPLISDAQVVNIPETSKKDFEIRYPEANSIEWTNGLAKYTVRFTLDNATYKAHYYVNGSWHYTEKFIEREELPKPVIESYEKSRIADWEFISGAYVENKFNEKGYRIEAKRGIEKKFIYFDEKGKELRSAMGI